MNTAAPRPVRVAGVLVGLQGLAGVVFAVWLLIAAVHATSGPVPVAATAAWLAGFGLLLFIVGINLVRGRHGARSPAVVAQLLLLGVCWYAAGPSSRPGYGVAAAMFCLGVLVLLFCPPAVRWAAGRRREVS